MTLRNYSSTAAQTTLSSGVDASATTLTVSATTGFPAAPFVLAIDSGAAAQELVLVTAVAGTTLTVTRAFDSTVAASHNTGAVVAHSHAAIDFREANVHTNATAAHGVAGAVVGTSDTQTLTNKTLTSPTISSPTILGVGQRTFVRRTTDQTISSTTLANDNQLSFSVEAGATYRVTLIVAKTYATSNLGNDLLVAVSVPAGTSINYEGRTYALGTGTAIGSDGILNSLAAGVTNLTLGLLLTTSATSGTVLLRHKLSNPTPSLAVSSGSWLMVERVA